MLRHALHIARSLIHEAHKRHQRSSLWPRLEHTFLKLHASCEACGGTSMLAVHHVQPFHLRPDLELDEDNLITLCTRNLCHLRIGHGGRFDAYVPLVRELARDCRLNPGERPAIEARARAGRRFEVSE